MTFWRIIVAGLVLGFGIKWLAFERFTIPTESMYPTLKRDDKVWVWKLNAHPQQGDIIAFKKEGENYVKRITGIPGQKVYKTDGKYTLSTEGVVDTNLFFMIPKKGETIILNNRNFEFYQPLIENYEHVQAGKLMDKIFINAKESNTYTFTQNYYFVQGDNFNQSIDSRIYGLIPEKNIMGKIILYF
jgi:signal peptidase I